MALARAAIRVPVHTVQLDRHAARRYHNVKLFRFDDRSVGLISIGAQGLHEGEQITLDRRRGAADALWAAVAAAVLRGGLFERSVLRTYDHHLGQRVRVYRLRVVVAVAVCIGCKREEVVKVFLSARGLAKIAAFRAPASLRVKACALVKRPVFGTRDAHLESITTVDRSAVVVTGAVHLARFGDPRRRVVALFQPPINVAAIPAVIAFGMLTRGLLEWPVVRAHNGYFRFAATDRLGRVGIPVAVLCGEACEPSLGGDRCVHADRLHVWRMRRNVNTRRTLSRAAARCYDRRT